MNIKTQNRIPADNRKWHKKAAYRVLMFIHDKAEMIWHWAYYKSTKFSPPRSPIMTVPAQLYGWTSKGKVMLPGPRESWLRALRQNEPNLPHNS